MSINTTTAYKIDIGSPYGELNTLLEWCNHNCVGEWGFQDQTYPPDTALDYTFYFDTERDYFAFLLWKK